MKMTNLIVAVAAALVAGAVGLRVSSSRGKNNFRGVKKKLRHPRKNCTCKTMPRPTAEFCPLENDNCA